MEVEFDDDDLSRLEREPDFDAGFSREIVRKFRMRMQLIRNAPDERDFYAMKGLHFEKMRGEMSDEYSMRLNRQFRLFLKFRGRADEKVVIIRAIRDPH